MRNDFRPERGTWPFQKKKAQLLASYITRGPGRLRVFQLWILGNPHFPIKPSTKTIKFSVKFETRFGIAAPIRNHPTLLLSAFACEWIRRVHYLECSVIFEPSLSHRDPEPFRLPLFPFDKERACLI